MKGGKDRLQFLDLDIVPGNAKMTLTHGTGPIFLTGTFCTEKKA